MARPTRSETAATTEELREELICFLCLRSPHPSLAEGTKAEEIPSLAKGTKTDEILALLADQLCAPTEGDSLSLIRRHCAMLAVCLCPALPDILPTVLVERLEAWANWVCGRYANPTIAAVEPYLTASADEMPVVDRAPFADLGERFEVQQLIGRGGYGLVYLARDRQLKRSVAIKIPKPAFLASAAGRKRFVEEARAVAQINHVNVCQVHDIIVTARSLYIVMEFICGQTLARILADREEPFSRQRAVEIIRSVACGVQAGHNAGVVHLDLKPANIMFDPLRDRWVVVDFSVARIARGRGSHGIGGTPGYMAPEQACGDPDVGEPADIYALGITLHELLTKTRPLTKDLHPRIDADLARVIRWAIADDPNDRPPAGEFVSALEQFGY